MPECRVSTKARESKSTEAAYFFCDCLQLRDWERLCLRVSDFLLRRRVAIPTGDMMMSFVR